MLELEIVLLLLLAGSAAGFIAGIFFRFLIEEAVSEHLTPI
ncbi:MAG: hypothetical protein ABFS28_00110 [Bacteroidota bacterium]